MRGKGRPKQSEVDFIEECKRKIRRFEVKGQWKEVADARNELGNQYRLLGMFEEALEEHKEEVNTSKKALKLKTDKSGRLALAVAYRNVAEVYIDMKDGDKAIPYIRKFLEMARELENFVEEQRAMITMGRAYLTKGEFGEEGDEERRTYFESGDVWFRKAYKLLMDTNLRAQLGNEKEYMIMKTTNAQNIGIAHEFLENNEKALLWLQKAAKTGEEHNLLEYLATPYAILASLSIKMKNYEKALSYARDTVRVGIAQCNLTQEIEGKILEAKSCFLLDSIQDGKKILKQLRKRIIKKKDPSLEGYIEEIEPLLVDAVKLSRNLDELYITVENPGNRKKLMKLREQAGDSYSALGAFNFAVGEYKKAVDLALKIDLGSTKKLSSLYFSIAESYKDYGDYERALEYYQKEISLYEEGSSEKFKTQSHITFILEKLKKKDKSDVVLAHEEAIRLAEETKELKHLSTAYQNYGMYLKSVKDEEMAKVHLKKAQDILEDINSEDRMDSQDVEELGDEDDDDDSSKIDLDNLSSDGEENEEEEEPAPCRNTAQSKKRASMRRNEAGETPLHLAAKKGDLTGVRKWLRMGGDVNARDTAGWTPLHEAANYGCASVAAELLMHGAKVSDPGGPQCEGLTPLHDALSNGHFAAADVLLENGANVLAKDASKRFPIDHLISWRGTVDELSPDVYDEYSRMITTLKQKMEAKGRPYSATDERKARSKSRREKSPIFTLLQPKNQDAPIPVKIAVDSFDPDNVEDATSEYKNAMESLSRKNKKAVEIRNEKRRKRRPISPGPRGALIPSDLDVHEDWMISDDVDIPVIEERFRNNNNKTPRGRIRRGEDENTPQFDDELDEPSQVSQEVFLRRSPSPFFQDYSSPSPPPPKRGERRREATTPSPPSSPESRRMRSRTPEDSPPLRRRRNGRLPSAEDDSEPIIIDDSDEEQGMRPAMFIPLQPTTKKRSSVGSGSVKSVRSVNSSSTSSSTKRKREQSCPGNVKDVLRLKIRVLERTLLVPVDSEKRKRSIQWLCEEAANRYKLSYGVKPILTLSTLDGALLCLSDPIDLVIGGGENLELQGTVKSLETPAQALRFQTMCADLKIIPKPEVLKAIKTSETSGDLDLNGINLQGRTASALFQSLHGNTTLKALNLAECCLFDEDIVNLGKVLPSLQGLLVLDLHSNGITFKGIESLLQGLSSCSSETKRMALRELDLCYNPLHDPVARTVANLAPSLPNLKDLRMAECNLSSKFYANLGLAEDFWDGEEGERFRHVDPDLLRSLSFR